MASIINASTSGAGGVITTADASGVLQLQTAGTTAISVDSSQAVTLTNALPVSSGGTGATTLTSNGVVLGNGTGSVTTVSPSTSGNVLTSNGTTWTSSAPVLDGMTLLGTITTTSGTSNSLSGLTLTSYRKLFLTFNTAGGIAPAGSGIQFQIGGVFGVSFSSSVQVNLNGCMEIDLSSGYASTLTTNPNTSATISTTAVKTGITTASTSVTLTANATVNFNTGSVSVYGVK